MKNSLCALLGLSLLLASCGQTALNAPAANTPTQSTLKVKSGNATYYADLLVVRYQGSAEQAAQLAGGQVVDRIPQLNTALLRLNSVVAGKNDALSVSARLLMSGQVVMARPLLSLPNLSDDLVERPQSFVTPQGLNANQYFDTLPQYAIDENHLNAKAAWDAGMTGKGVVIGTVDDPADVTHPDLKAAWAGKAYDATTDTMYTDAQSWINAIDGFDGKVDDKVDTDIEHGTAVTSSMVAAKDGQGIVGVAPDAKFLTTAIFKPAFIGDFYVAKALVWSVDNGANILNNSWGGSTFSSVIKDAMDYALSKKVTVVVSAGNTARDEWQDPSFPGTIVSGASAADNTKASFSTYGNQISTMAPGVQVLLASPVWLKPDGSRKTGYTVPGGSGYQLISGTSFSGPETAATAALMLGKNPSLTPFQIKRLMEETASGAGWTPQAGWGLLKIDKIVARMNSTQALPPLGANATVQVKVTSGDTTVPGILGDVILEPTDTSLNHQVYFTKTDAQGMAYFYEIAPGTYTLRAGAGDLTLTGGQPSERGTAVSTVTFAAGSPTSNTTTVTLPRGVVNLNPVDPYEPNDDLGSATPIQYGVPTQMAYIFGKPRDLDFFRFVGAAGDKITARVNARSAIGGSLDSFLVLRDASGKKLTFNDDIETGIQDSKIDFTLPQAGTYYLEVSSCNIMCASDGDTPSKGTEDDSPFNKYVLTVSKN